MEPSGHDSDHDYRPMVHLMRETRFARALMIAPKHSKSLRWLLRIIQHKDTEINWNAIRQGEGIDRSTLWKRMDQAKWNARCPTTDELVLLCPEDEWSGEVPLLLRYKLYGHGKVRGFKSTASL
ncbi:unnamed protein product [Penicillium bialowiezense]